MGAAMQAEEAIVRNKCPNDSPDHVLGNSNMGLIMLIENGYRTPSPVGSLGGVLAPGPRSYDLCPLRANE